jgi:hypothetical protein
MMNQPRPAANLLLAAPLQLQNASLVSNPYVSGGLSNADAAITVQLVVKNGQRYLSGTGTSNGGPYSFRYFRR